MLRKLRIFLAAVLFIGATLLFLDFTGVLHLWLGWIAKIQFLPALLAADMVMVLFLLIITLIFGRIYCSVICPLGVFQDCVSGINNRLKKKNRFRFSWSPSKDLLRKAVLIAFIVLILLESTYIAALIAPYSAFGRMVTNLLGPIWQLGNNLLAFFAEKVDSYAFYGKDVWLKSLPALITSVITFAVLSFLSWKNGRTYCNTICPVGTILGIVSKYSLLKVQIDTEKCANCGLCGKACKASCINTKEHYIDYSRCVACMDCIDNCNEGAISYKLSFGMKKKSADAKNIEAKSAEMKSAEMKSVEMKSVDAKGHDDGRRRFLATTAVATTIATTAKAQQILDGGLAPVVQKKPVKRETPLKPAGSISLKNFSQKCTACGLCVSKCPNDVLRPSTSLATLLQPEMSFERGYCRPECTICSEVCPTGAILEIVPEQKSSIQIGKAIVNLDLCVVNTDEVTCGNCARHCPSGAISMVRKNPDDEKSLRIPAVNDIRCIGCGACENLCPAQPVSAIIVEGLREHRII